MTVTCEDREDSIAALLENELPHDEVPELEEHLRACTACQKMREEYRELFELAEIPEPDEPDWDEETEKILALVGIRRRKGAAAGRVIRFPHQAIAAAAMFILLLPLAAKLVLVDREDRDERFRDICPVAGLDETASEIAAVGSLTGEQKAVLERIEARYEAKLRQAREMRKDVRALRNQLRSEVRGLLTEAQRERFDALAAPPERR